MKKAISWIDQNFEPLIITALFFAMTGLVTLQVILRFVFNTGFAGAEEISRFMFIWLMYFSFSYTTRRQRHIRLTFMLEKLPLTARKIVMIAVDLLFLTFSVIIFWAAWRICQEVIRFQDRAVTIDISMNIIYSAGLVGFGLMIIRIIQSIIWKCKNFNGPMDRFENAGAKYTENNNLIEKPVLAKEREELL